MAKVQIIFIWERTGRQYKNIVYENAQRDLMFYFLRVMFSFKCLFLAYFMLTLALTNINTENGLSLIFFPTSNNNFCDDLKFLLILN